MTRSPTYPCSLSPSPPTPHHHHHYHHHHTGAILFKVAHFIVVAQLSLALAGGLVVDGCTRRCRRRHRECPPPETATPSARTCVTSEWRSQWPLPSPRTIAHSARRRQGPGERHVMHYTATFRKPSPPRTGSAACCGTSVRACTCCSCAAVDQLPDIEHFFRVLSPDPEQVNEVPKILPFDVPVRAALPVTQLVEQLVEVPTIISFSSFQQTVEQHVDIPVPGGRGPSSGLQGFSSGQSSTALPSSRKRISERIMEQIGDPVSRGGLPGSLSGHGSSSSHFPAGVEECADEPGKGFFRTFHQNKKVRCWLRTRGVEPIHAGSSPSSGCGSRNDTLAKPIAGTGALERLPGSHRLTSMSCGTAKGMRMEGSGTGTGTRASLRLTSLLFLLGEGRHRQPRAVYKYWAPCRLCCVEIFFTVNNGHWFCHPRGTLLVLEAITLVQLIPAYGCTRTFVRIGL